MTNTSAVKDHILKTTIDMIESGFDKYPRYHRQAFKYTWIKD